MESVHFEPCGTGCYILSGSLNFASVPLICTQGGMLFDHEGQTVTLDLRGIVHTDSAGLALMMEWMRNAQQQGKQIHFKNIPAQMLSITRLSGLDTILPLT